MTKEMVKCSDGTYLEVGVCSLKEFETISDLKFKIACKKFWEFTKNFIRKGIEFEVKVIKALKRSTTH